MIFVMKTQEFMLIPKNIYQQQDISTLQVMKDPKIDKTTKLFILLSRNKALTGTSPLDKKIADKNILKSINMLTAAQKQKTREILKRVEASQLICCNETGELNVNKNSTKNTLSTILNNLQQPNKDLKDLAFSIV